MARASQGKWGLKGLSATEVAVARAIRKERLNTDKGDLFHEGIPEELLTPYEIPEADAPLYAKLAKKYKSRSANIRRSWNRLNLLQPELMRHGAPRDVLEMSTAHGAMLEVLRHFGHHVVGNDYVNILRERRGATTALRALNEVINDRPLYDYGRPVPGPNEPAERWPYEGIIRAQNIPMKLFDGGQTPYPFEDKSFDVVMCYQAIEMYCSVEQWMDVVTEFCRLSRESVVILLNPISPRMTQSDTYLETFHAFRRDLRNYDANGFHCVGVHMHWGEPMGFKLMAKG